MWLGVIRKWVRWAREEGKVGRGNKGREDQQGRERRLWQQDRG